MKRKGFPIALVLLMGIMCVIPLKSIFAEGTWDKCITKNTANCNPTCPCSGAYHIQPGNNDEVCVCVEGTTYAECDSVTGSEEGDAHCYAVGEHNDEENPSCDDVTIDWEGKIQGTFYSLICDTDPE